MASLSLVVAMEIIILGSHALSGGVDTTARIRFTLTNSTPTSNQLHAGYDHCTCGQAQAMGSAAGPATL
eukprot:scaffold434889_cov20-Prasinocladus_malaysianus.AAC.1